jgi:hypothetical protein
MRIYHFDSRNLLKAVPVEFTDLFESVPDVNLAENPWSDLPSRWGKIWEGKQSTDGQYGYSLTEVSTLWGEWYTLQYLTCVNKIRR